MDAEEDLPIYNEDGVDLTYVRWCLSMTPGERLAMLEASLEDMAKAWEHNGISLPVS